MEEDWDFYLTQRDGTLLSVYLNLRAYSREECRKFPLLFFIGLELLQRRQNGLTTNEEAETMYTIEDAMIEAVRALQVRYVARTTGGGRRIFHFYAAADHIEKFGTAIPGALNSFSQYKSEIRALPDPHWDYVSAVALSQPT